jgi:hypothetical protein
VWSNYRLETGIVFELCRPVIGIDPQSKAVVTNEVSWVIDTLKSVEVAEKLVVTDKEAGIRLESS